MFSSVSSCANQPGGCGWSAISFIFNDILGILMSIGLTAAIIMVSYAGFVLLKGQGDPSARSKAKKIFKDIILGLILLFGAYYIVDLILVRVGFTDRAGIIQPSGQ